jgi:hypothetical protein
MLKPHLNKLEIISYAFHKEKDLGLLALLLGRPRNLNQVTCFFTLAIYLTKLFDQRNSYQLFHQHLKSQRATHRVTILISRLPLAIWLHTIVVSESFPQIN